MWYFLVVLLSSVSRVPYMNKEPITRKNASKVLLYGAKAVLLILVSAAIALIIACCFLYLAGY